MAERGFRSQIMDCHVERGLGNWLPCAGATPNCGVHLVWHTPSVGHIKRWGDGFKLDYIKDRLER